MRRDVGTRVAIRRQELMVIFGVSFSSQYKAAKLLIVLFYRLIYLALVVRFFATARCFDPASHCRVRVIVELYRRRYPPKSSGGHSNS